MQTFRVIHHNKRASFLVQAKEINETNGFINSISGPFRMTSYDRRAIPKSKNPADLGGKSFSGLFKAEYYTFKPVKAKSI